MTTTGLQLATIPQTAAAALLNEIRSAKLEAMSAAYANGTAACGDYAADLPTVVLTSTLDGVTKTIRQDYGCSAAPRLLRQLHNRIDEVANTERWIGQR